MDCIFCKIVAGQIPNYTIYDDDQVLAFLDIHPHAKGHTVLIPKVHAGVAKDLNEELAKHLFPAIQKTMQRITRVLRPDGYNVGWNDGEAGGQVVPHLHIHIMPRWSGDGGKSQHAVVNNPGDTPVEAVAKLFT